LRTRDFLEIIIEQARVPIVIDAGIGAPSHALAAMELGADALLVNTAISVARDPVQMALAFRLALDAGELARQAGLVSSQRHAVASSPLTAFLSQSEETP
ncbi:MAG: thiazole synthase, partial [Serratia symbiotica]|nr:thiazole synthase [Serratia symbiotica]